MCYGYVPRLLCGQSEQQWLGLRLEETLGVRSEQKLLKLKHH